VAVKIERIVEEDLNLGVGPVDVTMPGGGTVVGHKIGPQSFFSLSTIASMDGGQPLTDGNAAVVQLDTEESDVGQWYSPSLLQFQPNVAGFYHFDAYLKITSFLGRVILSIYKNSTEIVAVDKDQTVANSGRLAVGALIELDGSSDFVTMRATFIDGLGSSVTIEAARLSGFIVGKSS
jgi:hypothetical protein